MQKPMPPKEFEDRIYKYWNENRDFTRRSDRSKKPYTIFCRSEHHEQLHMGPRDGLEHYRKF